MADVVIRKFNEIQKNEFRKKCLVITNYRHSFNYTKFLSGPHFRDETSYIFKAFPLITANVLVHKHAIGLGFPVISFPIAQSTWDKAFEICGNSSRVFDFEDTPFGKDYFDLFFDLGQREKIYYQDIYTGYVYYIPCSQFVFKRGIPYALHNFKDEFKRRYNLRFGDTIGLHSSISYNENIYHVSYPSDEKQGYFWNNAEIVLFIIISIFVFCLVLLNILITSFRKHFQLFFHTFIKKLL